MTALIEMVEVRKLIKRTHGCERMFSIKYHILDSFKEGVFLLNQSVYKTNIRKPPANMK